MTSTVIEWAEDFPVDLRASVEPLIVEYAWLLPRWLQRMFIYYTHEAGTTIAAVTPNYEYRNAQLQITSAWILNLPEHRRRTILHEYLHIVWEPLLNGIRALRDMVREKDPGAYKMADEMIRFGNESAIVDLTDAMRRFLDART